MTERLERRGKFVGALVGTGVGDAIGELAFRHPTREGLVAAVDRQEKLIYTDDTAMAIGVASSLVQVGGLDQQHLGDTLRKNYRCEPWRGYASGPPTVFTRVECDGLSYPEAAETLYDGQGSFGNGAAMRIAAIGLFFCESKDLYGNACESASVTHAHPIGIDGAAVQAQAVAQAVKLDPSAPLPAADYVQMLQDTARTPEMKQKLSRVRELIRQEVPCRAAAEELGSGVAVHQSQPFSVYCFLQHPDSFVEALFCAALNGGDRDTMGAMSCAIAGAYLGVQAIPALWREKLENYHQLERVADRLSATW